MRLTLALFGILIALVIVSGVQAQYYGEGGYYSESSYYGEGGYGDSQGGYEGGYIGGGSQGSFYGQGSYQSSYATPLYQVVGYVYADKTGNGAHDGQDPGILGETIQLLNNSDGSVISEGVSQGGEGWYGIINIPAGGYTVRHKREPIWPGWVRTTPRDVLVNVTSNHTFANFGFRAEMKGYVFEDNNRDGIFNSGDTGLFMRTVKLLNNSDGGEATQAQTDINGYYYIPAVSYNAGGYTITHTTVPSGWTSITDAVVPRAMFNFLPVSFAVDDNPSSSAPTISLFASPTTIQSGQTTTLYWSTTNATSCTASNGWSGAKAISGNQTISPTMTTTYTLTCSGPGGSIGSSAQVTVTAAPPSTVTLSGRVYRETSGGACSYNPGVDVPLGGQVIELDAYYYNWSLFATTNQTDGTYTISNIPIDAYYARYSNIPANHERVNPFGIDVFLNMNTNRTQDFCLRQIPAPTVTYSINTNDGISGNNSTMTTPTFTPISVKSNVPTTINWTISNANFVSNNWTPAITPPGSGSVSGSFTVPTNSPGTTLYTLTAANGSVYWGTGTFQVEVGNPPPFIQTTGGDVHTNESIYITPP